MRYITTAEDTSWLGPMNESCAHMKPKENILAISVLVMMVSCAAGVWCEVKPQVVVTTWRFITLTRIRLGLEDSGTLYHDNGSINLAGGPE